MNKSEVKIWDQSKNTVVFSSSTSGEKGKEAVY